MRTSVPPVWCTFLQASRERRNTQSSLRYFKFRSDETSFHMAWLLPRVNSPLSRASGQPFSFGEYPISTRIRPSHPGACRRNLFPSFPLSLAFLYIIPRNQQLARVARAQKGCTDSYCCQNCPCSADKRNSFHTTAFYLPLSLSLSLSLSLFFLASALFGFPPPSPCVRQRRRKRKRRRLSTRASEKK